MTDVALIDHQARCERTWAAFIRTDMGVDYYRADVLALPLANQEPPPLMVFELRPIPVEGITLADWFMVGAAQPVALQACELVSAQLTEITEAEFTALETAHRVERAKRLAVTNPAATLEAIDFAGPPRPHRAQRRASTKRKRR